MNFPNVAKFASIASLVTLTACSQELTRNKAGELLKESQQLQSRRETTPIWVGSTKEISPTHRILLQKGWLVQAKPSAEADTIMAVTDSGKQNLISSPANSSVAPFFMFASSNYVPPKIYEIPVAQPKFVEVTGIKEESENVAQVEFSYHWELTELGQDIAKADPTDSLLKRLQKKESRSTTATFEKYDDGWRLTKVAPTW